MYHWGSYASQLRRLGPIISPVYGEQIDVIAVGLKAATAAPSWFAS
jgi:hypothetical protein